MKQTIAFLILFMVATAARTQTLHARFSRGEGINKDRLNGRSDRKRLGEIDHFGDQKRHRIRAGSGLVRSERV